MWRRQAGARQLEVGWTLLAAETDNRPDHLLRVQQQFCTQQGRGRVHSVRRVQAVRLIHQWNLVGLKLWYPKAETGLNMPQGMLLL